jgi:hypothetical protein
MAPQPQEGSLTMQPVTRTRPDRPVMTVDEACEADRKYFEEHPDENEFIREFVPGEFGARELPEIPDGFRYATHVERLYREGQPVGRYRSLMAVCEGEELKRLVGA